MRLKKKIPIIICESIILIRSHYRFGCTFDTSKFTYNTQHHRFCPPYSIIKYGKSVHGGGILMLLNTGKFIVD
jgi:hypothetical protein